MKTVTVEIPEGKCTKWVNDVLTLVDEKPVGYKFNVGDKVKAGDDQTYTVIKQFSEYGEPIYRLKNAWGETSCAEIRLELVPQDITERIKTFDDAYKWCLKNNPTLCAEYNGCKLHLVDTETPAYLQLRIITAALNEGWKPAFEKGETLWCVEYYCADDICDVSYHSGWVTSPPSLIFKSNDLAEYASVQFRDLYGDLYGCDKGDESE